VKAFFDSHVRGSTPIDFNRYLRLIGLRSQVSWGPAVNDAGEPTPDYRMTAWLPAGANQLSLMVTDPNSVWAKAGLHTGDKLVSVNGKRITAWAELRPILRGIKIGDRMSFETIRQGRPFKTTVVVTGLQRPTVSVEQVPAATEKQQRLRAQWLAGTP
jgi:predicted metalloprotease with PDZ domain